jgi:hypothetical protein
MRGPGYSLEDNEIVALRRVFSPRSGSVQQFRQLGRIFRSLRSLQMRRLRLALGTKYG